MNIEAISDADDPRLEPYRNVKDPRLIQARGQFLVEGRLVIESLLRAPGFRVHSLLATDAALSHLAARGSALDSATPVYLVEKELLVRLSGVRFHQGCVAAAERAQSPGFEVFEAARRLVVLEQVTDPDNIGGIFRSSWAFGIQGVLLSPACASPLYRKASRTSMGAVFQIPFLELPSWPDALERLRGAGFRLVGLTPATTATAIGDFVPGNDKLALVFGTEGFGLSPEAFASLDEQVRIPMIADADSLNVATAVGIALHRLGIVSDHESI